MSVPQSLPSFAQAFSTSSLSDAAPISNALPPIQPRPSHSPPATTMKKRTRDDDAPRDLSPIPVRIKEEEDREDAHRPPQSPPNNNNNNNNNDRLSRDSSSTPVALQPLSKKRRVTVTGAPHGPAAERVSPIPISPAAPPLDDPAHRQIVLGRHPKPQVDQRRQSIASSDNLPPSKLARIGRVSPAAIPVHSRCAGNAAPSGSQSTTQPLTPPPIIAQQPPPLTSALEQHPPAATHSLAPPPISFARRRAAQPGGRKKKPADILISPRGGGPSDPLAPVIQSAPPVPDLARFQMAIPRLPLALNDAQATRRVAGNVPPTPTRFSLQVSAPPSISSTGRAVQSPPNLSVPIANTHALVPPTPHALHHPGYTGDKSAFLAPFEVFYDALNDSKQLKTWLSDQLQKSNTLMHSLKQQQEKMGEVVEDLVEKRTRVMREEITILRQRMESLEEALLAVRAESSAAPYPYPQGAKTYPNGAPPPPGIDPPPSYRFPAPEQRRPDTTIRVTTPEHQPSSSPPVEVARRLSVSAAGGGRPESSTARHGSFTLGGHSRRPSGSQAPAAKSTPPMRPIARSTETRPASRTYYGGTYGNGVGNPVLIEGQATTREGNKA